MTIGIIRIYKLTVIHAGYAKYRAEISSSFKGQEQGVVWNVTKRLKRDARALGEEALKEYQRLAMQAAKEEGLINDSFPRMPVISRFQDRRGLIQGMFGKTHSAESKVKISIALKARHAEGAFKGVRKGRLTNAERAERVERLAKEAGLTVQQYLHRQKLAQELKDKARAEYRAKHYFSPEEAAKIQRFRNKL